MRSIEDVFFIAHEWDEIVKECVSTYQYTYISYRDISDEYQRMSVVQKGVGRHFMDILTLTVCMAAVLLTFGDVLTKIDLVQKPLLSTKPLYPLPI